MTTTTAVEARIENHEATPQKAPSSPRKRRKRAPTAGAADDCFACQERQSKCDRRRPYCSQCLEIGKDCSGYKTALTWGVGVASRGKLRGLALPIADSRKAEKGTEMSAEGSKKRPYSELSKLGPTRGTLQSPANTDSFCTTSAPTISTQAATTTYDFVNTKHDSSLTSPMLPPPNLQWRTHARNGGEAPSRPSKRLRSHSLEPLQVAPGHTFRQFGSIPMTANALDGYRTHAFGMSMQCSPVTPNFSNYDAISQTYPGYSSVPYKDVPPPSVESPRGSICFPPPDLCWSSDSMSSSLGSDQDSHGYQDDQCFYADPVVANTLDDLLSSQPNLAGQETNITTSHDTKDAEAPPYLAGLQQMPSLVPDDVGAHSSLAITRAFPSLSIGRTPGLQFLIDYYDKVISPVIVAFDGPTNPYRTHILRLAVESETLQHAIAALSASNLRMRRNSSSASPTHTKRRSLTDCSHDNSVRKSSIAHSLMDYGMERLPQTSTSEPSMEELFHKTASIRALNAQLADPLRRKDDSILATLLILCLYHICDTGVAKFKTQFAGVKKILALRGGVTGGNSKATNWLTVMFTWFDAMTATVNDREDQLADIDTLSNAPDDWALENLAGCDGRLFKTIAKLGRLNMLSQGKPVREETRTPSTKTPKPQRRPSSPTKSQDYYSLQYSRLDGNGWSPVLPEDDVPVPDPSDARAQFWREWTEIRKALQEWQLSSIKTCPKSQEDYLDLNNISESFRYSALLYTERLAYPHLPSTHPNFQNLVTQALHHITSVKSDVFLLWPLFITGTECTSAEGRHLIRQSCLDIQKDSGFFNNISGLELLERIWRDDDDTQSLNDTGAQVIGALGASTNDGMNARRSCGSFKWRKAMDRTDGEYIVV